MMWIQTPNGRSVVFLGAALLGLAALATLLNVSGVHLSRPYRLAITGAVIVPFAWLVGRYWHSLDEAAQEAQKWAWFWGGSLGMGAGLVAMLIPQLGLAALASPTASSAMLMWFGGLIVAVAAVAGFTVAWAFWWMTRR